MSSFDFHSVFISFIRVIFSKFDRSEVHYFWPLINFKKIHIEVTTATFNYVRHFKTKMENKRQKNKVTIQYTAKYRNVYLLQSSNIAHDK